MLKRRKEELEWAMDEFRELVLERVEGSEGLVEEFEERWRVWKVETDKKLAEVEVNVGPNEGKIVHVQRGRPRKNKDAPAAAAKEKGKKGAKKGGKGQKEKEVDAEVVKVEKESVQTVADFDMSDEEDDEMMSDMEDGSFDNGNLTSMSTEGVQIPSIWVQQDTSASSYPNQHGPSSASSGASSSASPYSGYSPSTIESPPHHIQGYGQQPRMMMAAFAGLSFAGGLSYDWTYGGGGSSPSSADAGSGSRAWAQGLVRRSNENASASSNDLPVVHSFFVDHPGIMTGFLFLGVASVLMWLIAFVKPSLLVSSSPSKTVDREREREKGRKAALERLNAISSAPSDDDEEKVLRARDELLRLVGGSAWPVGQLWGLLVGSVRVFGRRRLGIFRGGFEVSEGADGLKSVKEDLLAWLRVVEIETSLGEFLNVQCLPVDLVLTRVTPLQDRNTSLRSRGSTRSCPF